MKRVKCSADLSAIFLFTTKTTLPRPQVFLVNDAFTLQLCSTFDVIGWVINRKILPNLVNSSWLWWITSVLLANQKRRNILDEQ